MPIQLFLMVISTMVIGVLFGWGFGAAAMRAALAVRDQVLLKSTLQQVQSRSVVHQYPIIPLILTPSGSAASSTNPDAVFKIDIFQGDFLDTRCV